MTTKGSQEQFPGKTAIPYMFYFGVCKTILAAAATVYQQAHFRRTESQELLHLCVTINFSGAFESIATSNLLNLYAFYSNKYSSQNGMVYRI